MSITDLTFLPRLGLDKTTTRIVSDKLFVVMEKDYLEEAFGRTNLLVIGSPAVNMAARVINDDALFRFQLPHARKFQDLMHSWVDITDELELSVMWRMAAEPARINVDHYADSGIPRSRLEKLRSMVQELLGGVGAKAKMNEFRKPGLHDPADGTLQATATRSHNDFGVVSIGWNPFAQSTEFVSILVAGLHGPGTAHALRALAEDNFREHPLGGIIEVILSPRDDWPTRFERAHWRWQTLKYDSEKVLTNLTRILKDLPGDRWATSSSKLIRDLVGSD
jgi:hypothetical protein